MKPSVGLMGLPAPAMGYEGMVQTPSGPMQVVDGIMDVRGRKLSVAEDGQVTDEQNKPIAKVVNGQLVPLQQAQQQPAPQGVS